MCPHEHVAWSSGLDTHTNVCIQRATNPFITASSAPDGEAMVLVLAKPFLLTLYEKVHLIQFAGMTKRSRLHKC
jgi:hypothetical protein